MRDPTKAESYFRIFRLIGIQSQLPNPCCQLGAALLVPSIEGVVRIQLMKLDLGRYVQSGDVN